MFGLRAAGKLDQRLESRLSALQREAMGVHPVNVAPQARLHASMQPLTPPVAAAEPPVTRLACGVSRMLGRGKVLGRGK